MTVEELSRHEKPIISLTCFPVKPWQITLVSLSIQTLAFADMVLTPTGVDETFLDAAASDRIATRVLIG